MTRLNTILTALLLITAAQSFSQTQADSVNTTVNSVGWLPSVEKRAVKLQGKLVGETEKILCKFLQKEEKVYQRMLAGKDSLQAKAALIDIREKYDEMQSKLHGSIIAGEVKTYIPGLDTLITSLKFLDQQDASGKIKNTLSRVELLQDKFQQAAEVKEFLRTRSAYLKKELEKLGLARQLRKLNKQVYYYSEQLNEYKELLKDHTRAEKKALELLSKTKLFRDFMRKNSQLASFFRLPGDPDDPVSQANLAGLQTRAQVNGMIRQQMAAGGPGAQQQFSQNIQQAQSQMNELKNKIDQLGKGSSDDIMPEGFKPDNQKTKSFLQRLELGTNIQSQKANGYFPVTSDIGLSLGYKLNDKSIAGIGASYKMGWGQNIRNINITHQGLALRSFVDWKIKGSLWVSGGYEMNYRAGLQRLFVSSPAGGGREGTAWQQSGLVGVSKNVSLKTKFFKSTRLQLLWDFLSYQQVPRTQPLVFRVGYFFKG